MAGAAAERDRLADELQVVTRQVAQLQADVMAARDAARTAQASAAVRDDAQQATELKIDRAVRSLRRNEELLNELLAAGHTPAAAVVEQAYAEVQAAREDMASMPGVSARLGDSLASSQMMMPSPRTPGGRLASPVRSAPSTRPRLHQTASLDDLYAQFEVLEEENAYLVRERSALFAELNSSRDSLAKLESTFDALLDRKDSEVRTAHAAAESLSGQVAQWKRAFEAAVGSGSPGSGSRGEYR